MKATLHLVSLLPDHPDAQLGLSSSRVDESPDPIDLIRSSINP